ncbi:hypothetical protein H4S02_009597, partial [Coemansia sp. RSA 2611]
MLPHNSDADDSARRSQEQIELSPWASSGTSLSAAPTVNSQSGKGLEAGKIDSPTPSQVSSACAKTLLSSHYEASTGIEEEKRQISQIRRRFIFVGLFFTIFLSGLDQTVTSTILTHIANDFKA